MIYPYLKPVHGVAVSGQGIRVVTDFSGTIVVAGGPFLGQPVFGITDYLQTVAKITGPLCLLERFGEARDRIGCDIYRTISELGLDPVFPIDCRIDCGKLYPKDYSGYLEAARTINVLPQNMVVLTDYWLHAMGALHAGIGVVVISRPLSEQVIDKVKDALRAYYENVLVAQTEDSYLLNLDGRLFVVNGAAHVEFSGAVQ